MKIVLTLIFLFLNHSSHATPVYLPGTIPLTYTGQPASDLMYEGKNLLPSEIHELHTELGDSIDIASLSPQESDLWRNDSTEENNGAQEEIEMKIDPAASFKYISPVESRLGTFRFTVTYASSEGPTRNFIIMTKKSLHNTLLRRGLLRKMGYYVPPMKHLENLNIHFKSSLEKEVFFGKMAQQTFGDPKRWIPRYEDHHHEDGILKDSQSIQMQDVVIFEGQNHLYNLAIGFIPGSIIRKRRILNSLLLPYSLTDIPESVNLFNWTLGRLANQQLILPYESSTEFSTTFYDAIWMATKIASLTRNDWHEIVKNAHYPKPVAMIILEKLISRRNHLLKILNIQLDPLKVNTEISEHPHLTKGKLTTEVWPGHAARYAYGNPDSPFSGGEFGYLIASRVISNTISNVLAYANKALPNINLQRALVSRQKYLFQKAIEEYLRTGKVTKIPFGIWAWPTFGTNVIISRDIVTGSYLGTDNTVQLADSVGISIDGGVYLAAEGLPIQISGTGNGRFVRTYGHLRPIKRFKAAVKYPIKNMLIPLLQKKYGKSFDQLLKPGFKKFPEEEQQKFIEEVLTKFKDQLSIGESLVITDSIGGGVNIRLGATFAKMLKVQTAMGANRVAISRLHIHRKDEDTIQIYKDKGNIASLIFSFNFKAIAPVMDISLRLSKGKALSEFYSLNINEDTTENPLLLKNLQALKILFTKNDIEYVKVLQKPYIVTNYFNETQTKLNAFFFSLAGHKSFTKLAITHPKGKTRHFVKSLKAHRKGIDIENFTINSINGILNDFTEYDGQLRDSTNGNPGDTLMGSSKNLNVSIESELSNIDSRTPNFKFQQFFAKITQNWRGWSIKEKTAKKILEEINKRYQFPLYSNLDLQQTKRLYLYNIESNLFIYEKGINYLINNITRAKDLFRQFGIRGFPRSRYKYYSYVFKKYQRAIKKGHYRRATGYLRDMVAYANQYLSFPGVVALVGGIKNLFVTSKIEGYRDGDEAGDTPIYSNTIGEIGSRHSSGPLQAILGHTKMTQSEFYGYWIMGRLQ
ncbi:hypothetical protein OAB57_01685 [Bacteriovoracaceae bacterium]|nr:hypothetical protein [Bacteriovoracaceae bacterium]